MEVAARVMRIQKLQIQRQGALQGTLGQCGGGALLRAERCRLWYSATRHTAPWFVGSGLPLSLEGGAHHRVISVGSQIEVRHITEALVLLSLNRQGAAKKTDGK